MAAEKVQARFAFMTSLPALLLAFLLAAATSAEPRFGPDYVDVSRYALQLDIRYATTNNFTGKNLYGDFRACFLHREAAGKLQNAVKNLNQSRPGWKFLVFDCLRPRSVQKILYAAVAGTSKQSYVAHPAGGSIHNFGFAMDLSLVDAQGREVDMGTPYDAFEPLAEPVREQEFLKSGRLTQTQHANRLILRSAMQQAGFIQLGNEWWHFDAKPAAEVRTKYRIIE